MDIQPKWTYGQSGHTAKVDIRPKWTYGQSGHTAKADIRPKRTYGQSGHTAKADIWLKWTYGQSGHTAKVDIRPKWTYGQSGHTAKVDICLMTIQVTKDGKPASVTSWATLSHELSFIMYHSTDRVVHTTAFCYTSCGALDETKNRSLCPPGETDLTHPTMSKCSTTEPCLAPNCKEFLQRDKK